MRRVRIRYHLGRRPRDQDQLLVLEERVRHRHHEALLQERPAHKDALVYHPPRDILRLHVLVRACDVHHHRLVPALRPMDVHAVEAEHGGVRQGFEGREAGEGFGAGEDAVAQAVDEVEPGKGGEVEGLHVTGAPVEWREEAWEGGGVECGLSRAV